MKKLSLFGILSIFLFGLLATGGSAQACFPPYPVFGDINYFGISQVSLELSLNDFSGNTFSTLINGNENGEYSSNLCNLGAPFVVPGMKGKIELVSCDGSPECTFSFTTVSGGKIDHDFIFGDVALQPAEKVFVCTDGSEVSDKVDCPVEEEEEDVVEEENRVSPSGDESASVDVFYGVPINIVLTDNKISTLFDGEISFDGEKYDAKEELPIQLIVETSVDDEDYGLVPHLTIKEGGIIYKYIFEEEIPLADIDEDDPLEINFMGRDIQIIEASASEMTVRSGEEYFLKEGDSVLVEGKKLKIVTIGDDSVLVDVNGVQEIIGHDSNREVNDINILVTEILYKDYAGAQSHVEIIAGIETDETVKDGDDFELFVKDADDWEWIIKLGEEEQWIGIKNVEVYTGSDEDEDYQAIPLGKSLSLPNNFIDITFDSVTEDKVNEMSFKVKDKSGKEYLFVKGGEEDTFNFGSKDYEELYLDATGIYDEDLVLITTDKVEIGDSNIFLELASALIIDLEIQLDMSDISFKGISLAGDEESFLDHLGITWKDPENGVEDQTGFDVTVPEERPEALITFTAGVKVYVAPKPIVSPEDEEDEEEGGTETVIPPDPRIICEDGTEVSNVADCTVVVPPPPVIICEDGTEVVDKADCPIKEEQKWGDTLFEQLITLVGVILTAIGVQWNRGILGIVKYHWNKGNKAQAMKTLFTLVKKAKAGYYDKKS